MRVVIPSHPTRATEHRLDKKLYRIRYRIECLFHRLKRCRRLATRYEKTRAIARGSAMESGALLDIIRLFNVVPQEDWAQAKALLVRVVEMLSKMC